MLGVADSIKLLGPRNRQGLEHHCMDQREDRRGSPDAERQREDRGKGEGGSAAHLAAGMAYVLPELVEPYPPARFVIAFLAVGQVSDVEMRPPESVALRQALLAELF